MYILYIIRWKYVCIRMSKCNGGVILSEILKKNEEHFKNVISYATMNKYRICNWHFLTLVMMGGL